MDKPFSLLVFALILGILISNCFDIQTGMVLVVMGIILVLFIINIIKARSNNLNIFILFCLIGILITQLNKESKLFPMVGDRSDYIGRVVEITRTSDTDSKYIVLVERQENNIINEKIVLTVIGNKILNFGDQIHFNGVLNLPLANTNPMLYNHKLNLLSNKIHTTMSIKDYSISRIDENDLFRYEIKSKFRNDVEVLFKTQLNEKNSNLITSIILGKSSYLDEDDLLKYRDLGLAHILAVSGLHIGIISGFILFLISRIGIKRNINYIMTLSIMWFYGFLIGYSPSTLRAIIMFSILFYSMSIHEPYDSLNTISFAMLILLILNPFWLFSISFQLSFIATISIILLTPKITTLIYPYRGKTLTTIAMILGVNIGLFPVQAYYFNKLPLLGILANLITIPILSLSLIIGMIMVVLNYIFPIFNDALGAILNLMLNIELFISNALYNFPINIIKVFSPGIISIFLYYILIAVIFNFININKFDIKIKKLIIFYLLFLTLGNSIIMSMDNNLEIHFIDVGQGDSIFIKSNNKNYLIDTGGSIFDGFDITGNITLPYLQKSGIFKLDSIFISHFDEDHSKGLEMLVDNMTIGNIYASYIPENKSNLPLKLLKKGHIINIDKNSAFYVLWPEENNDNENLSSNNKSLVLLLKYYNYSILFTGDIEKEVELKTIEDLSQPLDILKVGHHGSNTSSTYEFLNKAMPKNSIISVGRNNSYNHPNKEVIERLKDIDSTLYRTDEMGLIKVTLSKDDIKISPFLRENTTILTFINENIYYLAFYLIYFMLSYLLVLMYKRTMGELEGFEL